MTERREKGCGWTGLGTEQAKSELQLFKGSSFNCIFRKSGSLQAWSKAAACHEQARPGDTGE